MQSSSSLKPLEECLGFVELRKTFFFLDERSRMDATPGASKLHRMLQMQHLVIDDVLHRITWHIGAVEKAADHDGVVSGIVVAEVAAGVVRAPGKTGAAQKPV